MEMWAWLWSLSVVATVHGKALLDLTGQETANGTWRDSVTLPCGYVPSVDFKVFQVTWKYIGEDQDVNSIFIHDSSGDHTLLTNFRGRLSIAKKPPGDVSLQINDLEMTDTGEYICKVEWEATNTSRISKERTTQLKVIKVPVSKPFIQSSSLQSILPSGTGLTLTCLASGSPPIQYKWFKELMGAEVKPLQGGAVLAFDRLQISDSARYFCTAENRPSSHRRQQSDSVLITVKDASKFSAARPGTTSGEQMASGTICCHGNTESTAPPLGETVTSDWKEGLGIARSIPQTTSKVPASQRQGLPMHLTVSIALLCATLLLVILSVVFCRRRRTKNENAYDVTYHNNALTLANEGVPAGPGVHGASVYEEPSLGFGNHYVEEPPKDGGEYVAMGGQLGNEYEILVNEKELKNGSTTFK